MTARGVTAQRRISALEPPQWVFDLVPGPLGPWEESSPGLQVRVAEGSGFAVVEVRVPGALALGAGAFESACAAAYGQVFRRLAGFEARHPVRMWNFVPRILDPLGEQPHRYMHFNFGRYAAFSDAFGSGDAFRRAIPTASGVGHDSPDLKIVSLSATSPGCAIENPRQIASYCYSHRWGLLPPCFARATRIAGVDDEPLLLVGGTASVCGEDSVHLEDLEAQAQETFLNLAVLVQAAEERPPGPQPTREAVDALLRRYHRLRVYYVHAHHRDAVHDLVRQRFPAETEAELLRADLCRPELLIEIEGLARLQPAEAPAGADTQ